MLETHFLAVPHFSIFSKVKYNAMQFVTIVSSFEHLSSPFFALNPVFVSFFGSSIKITLLSKLKVV